MCVCVCVCTGSVKIEISFHVDANGVMNATARDMNTQRQEQW